MDRVSLRAMRVLGRHGWTTREREHRQPFEITLDAEIDLSRAERSDDLADTVDYGELHHRLAKVVATTSYALLERLAADLIAVVFEDTRIARATLTIAKPEILDGATPSVTLARENPRYQAP